MIGVGQASEPQRECPAPTPQALTDHHLAESQFSSFFAQGHAFPPACGALIATYGLADAYVVDNKIDPGGTTGWHGHPGPSFILVVSGQVTNCTGQDPNCAGHTYSAGQGFIDSGGNDKHTLRNNGTTQAETIAVQLIPDGALRKIDEPNPTPVPSDDRQTKRAGAAPERVAARRSRSAAPPGRIPPPLP